ncbi:MAG: TIM barrel protein [Spirochaetia bacterium]|jgi:sugar phosphate isomerase/epimerase|nr:TIM barrel protein [Spirochaetia bacterium]
MYLTGFADEAADSLSEQIEITKSLGWKNIESRNIDGVNIHDIPERKFNFVCNELEENGIAVNCFGSTVANWGVQITDSFEGTMEKIDRSIPRMQRLGTKLIRMMSYARLKNTAGVLADDQMEEERFRRLRIITDLFLDAGITPVHENCMNYGGMGWSYTLKMLENVPGLKLVFDTGNPVANIDHSADPPDQMQSSWEFYQKVKEHIAYIHIKDAVFNEDKDDLDYCYPGEGDGDVREIVKDLLENGYNGGISMEPHMAVVFHDKNVEADSSFRRENYLEYGRRFMKLLEEVKANV